MTTKKLSAEEREQYRQVVALILGNDPEHKKHVDNAARLQLAALRSSLPNADNEIIVTFMLSFAVFMAKLMTTPLSDLAEAVQTVFGNNIVATAHVLGAYDFDDPADMPKYDDKAQQSGYTAEFAKSFRQKTRPPADIERELNDILARQYL